MHCSLLIIHSYNLYSMTKRKVIVWLLTFPLAQRWATFTATIHPPTHSTFFHQPLSAPSPPLLHLLSGSMYSARHGPAALWMLMLGCGWQRKEWGVEGAQGGASPGLWCTAVGSLWLCLCAPHQDKLIPANQPPDEKFISGEDTSNIWSDLQFFISH